MFHHKNIRFSHHSFGGNGYENGHLVAAQEFVVPDDATEAEIAAGVEFMDEEKVHASASMINELPLPAEQKEMLRGFAFLVSTDIVRRFLMEVVDSPKPKLTCNLMASAFGLRIRQGISDSDLAREFGVSKQDILNSKKRLLEKLGVKVVTRSTKQHTEKNEKRNFRHPKKLW